MCEKNPVYFRPDGNDLKRIFYYFGLEFEEKIICPFHDDNNPSCHIDFDEGTFHCFACGAGGDAYKFVDLATPKLNGLRTLILYHAIIKSDKVSKLKLQKVRVGKAKKQKMLDKLHDQEMAQDQYYGLKTIDWRKEKSTYKDYMLKRGFTSRTLNMCGAKLTYTDNNYPIIFPIMDMDQFKGYVCRTTDKRVEKRRKYLYNKGFSRIDTLAGRYDNEVVVLCEGYMDALKLRQFGVKYYAAILGWKITSQQVQKLRSKGVKYIISALDTDKPGRKGTDYLANFFEVVPFQFPRGAKDPGDLDQKQFDIANRKTKKLFREIRRKKNVNSK